MSEGKGLVALVALGALGGLVYAASTGKNASAATPTPTPAGGQPAQPGGLTSPIPVPASAPPIPAVDGMQQMYVRSQPFLVMTARDAFKTLPWNLSALAADMYATASQSTIPYLQQFANWLFTSGYAKASEVIAARAGEVPNLASLPVVFSATLDAGLPIALRARLWSLTFEQRWPELAATCDAICAQYPKACASFKGILQIAGENPGGAIPQVQPQAAPPVPVPAVPIPNFPAPPVPVPPVPAPPQAAPPQAAPPMVIPTPVGPVPVPPIPNFPAPPQAAPPQAGPPAGLPPLPQVPPVPPGMGIPPQTPPGGAPPAGTDQPPPWWPAGVPWPGSGALPGGGTGALFLPPGASWNADKGMIAYVMQSGDYSATKVAERFKKKVPGLWAKSAVVANPGKKWGKDGNIHVGTTIFLQPEWGMVNVQTPPVEPYKGDAGKPAAKPSVIIQTDKPMPAMPKKLPGNRYQKEKSHGSRSQGANPRSVGFQARCYRCAGYRILEGWQRR